MYIRVKDLGENLLKKVKFITNTDFLYDEDKTLITVDSLIGMIEELVDSYEQKQEELDNLEKNLEDNYKHISSADQYDVSDDDFIEWN